MGFPKDICVVLITGSSVDTLVKINQRDEVSRMEVLSVLNDIQMEYISRVNKLLWGIALWACGTYH